MIKEQKSLFSILGELPYQRISVWGSIIFFSYSLKPFFGIAMGTFILSFIGLSFVNWGRAFLKSRGIKITWSKQLFTLQYFAIIALILALFGTLTIPDVVREGADFIRRLQSENVYELIVQKAKNGLGDEVMIYIERFLLLVSSDDVIQASGQLGQEWTPKKISTLGNALSKMFQGYTDAAVRTTTTTLTVVTKFLLQTTVSLILSFIFIWDYDNIASWFASLRSSRLKPVYDEVTPVFLVFGKLFGIALQAQFVIAIINTVLTAVGMAMLKIPGLGFLSLFVFLCSFIPVAGCLISTIPIGFVALTEYGFMKLALVIMMVTMVHFVEAYGLNPMIYSAHLKIHPLIVLCVLVVAEHHLGVWGLLLAVPLTVFTHDFLIQHPKLTLNQIAKMELQNVSMSSVDDHPNIQLNSEQLPKIEKDSQEGLKYTKHPSIG